MNIDPNRLNVSKYTALAALKIKTLKFIGLLVKL